MALQRGSINRRAVWLMLAIAAGCVSYAARPTAITSTGATLHAQVSCSADTTSNPCTGWFQYWQDGATDALATTHVPHNLNTNGYVDFNWTLGALSPSTLYHYEICGFGDSNVNPPGLCTGPLSNGKVNTPGTLPDTGNLDATANFRTASATQKGTYDLGRVLSTADTDDKPITRDAGMSVVYSTNPPRALWMFGDTQQNHVGFIPFGSAANGAFSALQAPSGLNELPTPPATPSGGLSAPAGFFPPPQGLLRSDGGPCGENGSYAADWVMGGAKEPSVTPTRLLLVYAEMCIETNPLLFTLERVAFAEYDPAANRFLRIDRPFVASPLNAGVAAQRALDSPVFASDGFVYFFIADCQGVFCSTKGAIEVARVPATASAWSSATNFRWWNGSSWVSNSTLATSIIAGATPLGGGVAIADYSAFTSNQKKFVLLEQVGFGNASFKTFTATSPTGPWSSGPATTPPDACSGGTFGCYAVQGHPELSNPSQLVYSWYSVDDRDGYGHLRLGAVDW